MNMNYYIWGSSFLQDLVIINSEIDIWWGLHTLTCIHAYTCVYSKYEMFASFVPWSEILVVVQEHKPVKKIIFSSQYGLAVMAASTICHRLGL